MILAACVVGVQAQTPDLSKKHAAIQELLNLSGDTQRARGIFLSLIEQYFDVITKNTIADFEQKNWTPAEKEKGKAMARDVFARVSKRLREELPARIQYDEKVNRLYLELYDQRFSEAEIQELIAFYKSPIGQKVLAFEPSVAITLQQKTVAEFQEPIITITRAIIDEEMKKLEESVAEPKNAAPRPKN